MLDDDAKRAREKKLHLERCKKYREKHKEALIERRKSPEYQETIRKQKERYYKERGDFVKEKARLHKRNNNGIVNYANSLRKERVRRATPKWADRKEIRKIYVEAALKSTASEKLHVDHIIPITHTDVCGLNIPLNLQIISGAENVKKGNLFNGKKRKTKSAFFFMSESVEWATSNEFFNKVNEEFKFDVDVCATKENAKCEKYFTKEMDGLQQKWEGNCWMNPPYGRNVDKWLKKAYESNTLVVCLIPARFDTKWWRECVTETNAEVRFIAEKLKFSNPDRGIVDGNAPFPCALVIYKPR